MKHLFAALAVALLLPRADPPEHAEAFARIGARELQFRIESAAAASVKGERADVRLLAEELLVVSLAERTALVHAMAGDGLAPDDAPSLSDAQQKDIGVLIATSGSAFDDAFLDQQRKGLERSLALFRSFAGERRRTQLEAFAKSRLPETEAHLSHLRGLSASAALPLG